LTRQRVIDTRGLGQLRDLPRPWPAVAIDISGTVIANVPCV
jgi:hypothetical protein